MKKTLAKIGNFHIKHWGNPLYGLPFAAFIFLLMFGFHNLGIVLCFLLTIFIIICMAYAIEDRQNEKDKN